MGLLKGVHPKYSVDDRVEMLFRGLAGRYKPFCMYQYCSSCGAERPRSNFRMIYLSQKSNERVTSSVCAHCVYKKQHGMRIEYSLPPKPMTREAYREFLIKLYGSETSRLTVDHKRAISRGVRTAHQKRKASE